VDASVPEEIERAAAASEVAERPLDLAAVFDAHATFVGRTLRCLGVHDREVPDAMQEVFLVVHRRLPELRKPSALRSWLYAICLRKAMALRRKAARRREESMAEPPEPRGERSTPHDDLEKARALAAALEMLDGLDDDKRAVFVLYEVEQLPMSEVADAVGCPLQTAYSRLYAARRDIKRTLARLRARGEVDR
jgi:RNA polymerase sigma-70 factor (ECF subfamily)